MGKHRFSPGTRRFADVPHAPCVYAVELSDGTVKVGASSSARGRMMSLASEVRRFSGTDLVRFHVVVKLTAKAAYEAETSLVQALDGVGQRVTGRREFFSGVSFEAACQMAEAAECAPYRPVYRYVRKTTRSHRRQSHAATPLVSPMPTGIGFPAGRVAGGGPFEHTGKQYAERISHT